MKPTEAQLSTLYKWFSWQMPTPKARDAIKWLENNSDKRTVSDEIKRVGGLYHDRKLNEPLCFDSEVWADYLYKEASI